MTGTPRSLLADFAARHLHQHITVDDLAPICQGASGRYIARLKTDAINCIAIYWTDDRPDNASFVPVAKLLHECGIHVPDILADEIRDKEGLALVQDLGDTNLLSLKGEPWEIKKKAYMQALEQVHLLHGISVPSSVPLQPAFDEAMYRWEQEYFAEHFVANMTSLDKDWFTNHADLISLAEQLSVLPVKPVHRDFQSQNVHIIDSEAWLIDFQGMRMGLPEYDLASIIYDPYAGLSSDERSSLLDYYGQVTGETVNRELLTMCAQQRLMQALGAFAKLSRNGNAWYGQHIKPAVKTLSEISATSLLAEPIGRVVHCLSF